MAIMAIMPTVLRQSCFGAFGPFDRLRGRSRSPAAPGGARASAAAWACRRHPDGSWGRVVGPSP